jgi:hypothetical protein
MLTPTVRNSFSVRSRPLLTYPFSPLFNMSSARLNSDFSRRTLNLMYYAL